MVGFNRRYARTRSSCGSASPRHGPRCVVYTVNAGAIAADHWNQDLAIGAVGSSVKHVIS